MKVTTNITRTGRQAMRKQILEQHLSKLDKDTIRLKNLKKLLNDCKAKLSQMKRNYHGTKKAEIS